MRLTFDRHSDVAFERVVNLPPRGIGDKTVDVVRSLARDHSVSLWKATEEGITNNTFSGRAAMALSGFVELIEQLAAVVENAPLHEIAKQCID